MVRIRIESTGHYKPIGGSPLPFWRELAFFEDLTLVIDFEEVTLKVEVSAVLPMMNNTAK